MIKLCDRLGRIVTYSTRREQLHIWHKNDENFDSKNKTEYKKALLVSSLNSNGAKSDE